jgi:adenylosuccinate lyase
VLRRYGHADAYEQLKALTRGRQLRADDLRTFVSGLDLPRSTRDVLLHLTPATYTGLAEQLAARLDSELDGS